LTFAVDSPRYTATISGTTFAVGNHTVTVRSWEYANFAGGAWRVTLPFR